MADPVVERKDRGAAWWAKVDGVWDREGWVGKGSAVNRRGKFHIRVSYSDGSVLVPTRSIRNISFSICSLVLATCRSICMFTPLQFRHAVGEVTKSDAALTGHSPFIMVPLLRVRF